MSLEKQISDVAYSGSVAIKHWTSFLTSKKQKL